jgi:hypothetical protein
MARGEHIGTRRHGGREMAAVLLSGVVPHRRRVAGEWSAAPSPHPEADGRRPPTSGCVVDEPRRATSGEDVGWVEKT